MKTRYFWEARWSSGEFDETSDDAAIEIFFLVSKYEQPKILYREDLKNAMFHTVWQNETNQKS